MHGTVLQIAVSRREGLALGAPTWHSLQIMQLPLQADKLWRQFAAAIAPGDQTPGLIVCCPRCAAVARLRLPGI